MKLKPRKQPSVAEWTGDSYETFGLPLWIITIFESCIIVLLFQWKLLVESGSTDLFCNCQLNVSSCDITTHFLHTKGVNMRCI